MIHFTKEDGNLLLHYSPDFGIEVINAKLGISFAKDGKLIEHKEDSLTIEMKNLRGSLHKGFSLTVKRIFFFDRIDLVHEKTNEENYVFILGALIDSYYKIEGRIFGISQDVLMCETIKFDRKLFSTGYEGRTSIMGKIGRLVSEAEHQIIIGGNNKDAIPEEDLQSLIDNFPNTYELHRIADARIASHIQDYLETKKDYVAIYEKYSKRRRNKVIEKMTLSSKVLYDNRLEAFSFAKDRLSFLLKNGDAISEENWQQGILEILPILFPQYICVFPKVKVSDKINSDTESREIDFLLVDASGNVDVLEIKKGFKKNSLISTKPYRDNFIPAKELTGGIMQIEKYIYYLLNWGQDGEKVLTKRYSDKLPERLTLRFLNPKGLLIMGNCEFTAREQQDFDLIRRKYSKIVDIITYNDFINRLERVIGSLRDEAL